MATNRPDDEYPNPTFVRSLVRWGLGRRLPIVDGTIEVRGPTAPVTVDRDDMGVPTITGETYADVIFGLGFATGQDRSFQLEFTRRAASGELAAMLGPEALPVDRLVRRIGYRRAAEAQWEATPPERRALLQAYADGINAGLGSGLRRKAHEFALLRSEAHPWSGIDVLAFVKVIASALSTNWDTEFARLVVASADGLDALMDCDPGGDASHRPTIPASELLGPSLSRTAEELQRLASVLPLVGASNNWAVAPSRTVNQHTLVSSDPHLNPTAPTYWYLAALKTPTWTCAGATLVGAPTIIIGQNDTMAWSVTAGRADESDLFIEEFDDARQQVKRPGGWTDVRTIEERIEVRGGDTVVEQVVVTDRGPVISPALAGAPWMLSLAATWLATEPLRGFFDLPVATCGSDLRAAFDGWAGPPVNICHGTADGHIGWTFAATVPSRERWGLLPQRGCDVADGWGGLRSGEALPWVEDPPDGFVATANNQPVVPGRPDLGDDWVDGYRVARIHELLERRADWDVTRCMQLQMDARLTAWPELRRHAESITTAEPRSAVVRDLLLGWDGVSRPDGPESLLAEAWIHYLAERLYKQRVPNSWRTMLGEAVHELSGFTSLYSRRLSFLVKVLHERPVAFAASEQEWRQIIDGAVIDALDHLEARLGPELSRWSLTRARPLVFKHPLSAAPRLRGLFDIGPVDVGGSLNTVSMAASHPVEPWQPVLATATLRATMDANEPHRSRYALPGGQSGNVFSPHHRDQLPFWEVGAGVPVWPGSSQRCSSLVLAPVG